MTTSSVKSRMVSFDDGDQRFQMRAAGIAIRHGHVLVHRPTWDRQWTLPGGRVDLGETSAETVAREMVEELGQVVSVGRLLLIGENFFTLDDRVVHEFALFYEMTLPETFPFLTDDICHRSRDGDNDLEFRWVPTDRQALSSLPLRPEPLHTRLGNLPAATELFTVRLSDD
jgi:ADP-ribose pyrophosphatase YjhB (NUDIX family)